MSVDTPLQYFNYTDIDTVLSAVLCFITSLVRDSE